MITGATAGFGRATAIKFAENGYKVIITGRRKERLDDLEKELSAKGAKVLSLNFDVRKRYEVEDIIGSLPDEWKNIDIPVSYTHLRAHETVLDLVCRLLLEKKKTNKQINK